MPRHAILLLFLLAACFGGPRRSSDFNIPDSARGGVYLVVLGIAQDGGYPHAGCQRDCCQRVANGHQSARAPVCLGLVDERAKKVFLLEATPAFAGQWRQLQDLANCRDKRTPDGIFLTHAHVGHYAGLMQLGREIMGAKNTPVWAMPRMEKFLRENGPWSQLVGLNNISLQPLRADSTVQLTPDLRITPFTVPHRDEFSETVGYRIESPRKKLLFIPDIDKWEKWPRDIVQEVGNVDFALLDATFFRDGELVGRTMQEVPHPFVAETMQRFAEQPATEKRKVTFIHLNHTNPLIWDKKARREVHAAGFSIAEEGLVLVL
ncbi:MAG: MBL fold metallo-hydrolase [Saprospiraceae bacterium]